MSKTPNLHKLLDSSFDIQEVNWTHPDNVQLLENARKEYSQMLSIIDALSDYGPGIDIWEAMDECS